MRPFFQSLTWPQLPHSSACVGIGSPHSLQARKVGRFHGAPHCGQQPLSLVPARMQGSTSFSGKVAKCASEKGCVAIVHTLLLLRPAPRSTESRPDWSQLVVYGVCRNVIPRPFLLPAAMPVLKS